MTVSEKCEVYFRYMKREEDLLYFFCVDRQMDAKNRLMVSTYLLMTHINE